MFILQKGKESWRWTRNWGTRTSEPWLTQEPGWRGGQVMAPSQVTIILSCPASLPFPWSLNSKYRLCILLSSWVCFLTSVKRCKWEKNDLSKEFKSKFIEVHNVVLLHPRTKEEWPPTGKADCGQRAAELNTKFTVWIELTAAYWKCFTYTQYLS